MSGLERDPAIGPRPSMRPAVERVTGAIAISGGLLALGVAGIATASVALRWLFGSPIEGDFEYVKMATSVAVFSYLPYTQARRGNIMVDTFTARLSSRSQRALDALWDACYAALMGFIAWCLAFGVRDAITSGETTMQKQLPLWPSIALSFALCAVLALTALWTAIRLIRAQRGSDAR